MQDGFIRVAAGTPKVRVADTGYNADRIIAMVRDAAKKGVKLLALPELCLTGYTCGDLFLQYRLIESAKKELFRVVRESAALDILVFAGLPWLCGGKLYNVACAFQGGRILALIPKTYLPNYGEFYEQRYFIEGARETIYLPDEMHPEEADAEIPFGTDILIRAKEMPELCVGAEICEDGWTPYSPSNRHAVAGATVIVNLSASNELVGKGDYRRQLIRAQSSRLLCAYLYASAGEGESTSDLVFSGHNLIAEAGDLLTEKRTFAEGLCITEIDLLRILHDRYRMSTFESRQAFHNDSGTYGIGTGVHTEVSCSLCMEEIKEFYRGIPRAPFSPSPEREEESLSEMLSIQVQGLRQRMSHIGAKYAVIGLSGGLDSTLALLVAAECFKKLSLPPENLICVTMPAFGTTDRTHDNAKRLAEETGASLREIDIKEALRIHFRDIGHDPAVHNAAYENAQARERTQILMDLANDVGGIVIGTGDMSELALGWCTYNGDHMSMYAVNAGIPKTLVRALTDFYARKHAGERLSAVLSDILHTPVSPELLPPDAAGEIAQKTEDIIGPYELHDFFLYHMLRSCFPPKRIYRMAVYAFSGVYDKAEILKWEKVFYRRFFSQQFKRSCSVDGPKVTQVDLSPRGSLRMASDAQASIWLSELEEIKL